MNIQTYDEILTFLCDEFDRLIAPKKILRADSNTLYLELKNVAKGFETYVNSAALVVNNKFSPDKSSDFDIQSLARIVGTQLLSGKGSGLSIVIRNDGEDEETLLSGEYVYVYNADTSFFFELLGDVPVPAGESIARISFSDTKGSHRVTAQSTILVRRVDYAPISNNISFSCLDNADMLGKKDETVMEFRNRLLGDTNRQDVFSEMEIALRNLPRVLDARVVFNSTNDPITVDGITIQPFHFLLTINGDITNEVAQTVVRYGYYPSTQVSPTDFVVFESPVMQGGAYKVFYKNFDYYDYDLNVSYSFDSSLTSDMIIQRDIENILTRFMYPSGHTPFLTEGDFYEALKSVVAPSFRLLDVSLEVGGVSVSYVEVPRTRYPRLVNVVYNGGV